MGMLHGSKYVWFSFTCQIWHCLTPCKGDSAHIVRRKWAFFLELFFWQYFGGFCYSVCAGLSLLSTQMSTRTSMRQSVAACVWDHLFWQKQAVKWAQLPHDTSLNTKQQVTGFPKSYLFHQEFKTKLLPAAVGKDQICIATQAVFVQGLFVKDEIKPLVHRRDESLLLSEASEKKRFINLKKLFSS